MKRSELVLAAMAPAGGHRYTPVQMQKLLFLLDREIPELMGGPHFKFEPHDYGPFDKQVYVVLDRLSDEEMVDIHGEGPRRTFALTPNGQREGERLLNELEPKARNYVVKSSGFVRSLTFSQLVSAIYKAYPEMRVNSVFQG